MSFDEALDQAEEDSTDDQPEEEPDVEAFIDRANADGDKERTIGVGVTKEMHYLYKELRQSDDVDVDIIQGLRDHIERLARRHPEVAERARQKYNLDH